MNRMLRITICLAGLAGCAGPGAVGATHPDHDQPAAGAEPTAGAVKIEVREGFRYISSNGLPNHATGRFPGPGNPNAISAQRYSFRVSVKPRVGDKPTSIGSTGGGGPPMFPGVALNGVVFDPGTAEWWRNDRASGWNYEALSGKINLGVDSSHAHVQPNGAYHYHGVPTALVEQLAGGATKKGSAMVQAGWAADGYPIYAVWGHEKAGDATSAVRELKSSYRVKSGERPAGESGPGGAYDGTFVQDYQYVPGLGDLDECNGRTGVTPEFPDGTYYYVITNQYPFVPRLLHGVPDDSFTRHGPRGGGRGGPPRRGGPGGPGGRGDRPPPPRP